VLFTPYLGLKLLPHLAKLGAHENPDRSMTRASIACCAA